LIVSRRRRELVSFGRVSSSTRGALEGAGVKSIGSTIHVATVGGILALAWITIPAVARAQCAFNGPTKAGLIKSSLVRHYATCPSETFPAPNTSSNTDTPGCAPPYPSSVYQFGPKGSCTFQMKTKLEDPCPDGCPDPCMRFRYKLKCTDVRDASSEPIAAGGTGTGWSLTQVFRATLDDAVRGDMTIVEIPTSVNVPAGDHGKLSMNVDPVDTGLLPFFFGCPAHPPACSSFQLQSLALRDPGGNIFAVLGSSTR